MAKSFKELVVVLDNMQKALDVETVMPEIVFTLTELRGDYRSRIFDQGLNTDKSSIGSGYSKTPSYYNESQFILKSAFNPGGKTSSSSTFKNGNQRKSMYLSGGYSELRIIQGRTNPTPNFKYSGDLELSFDVVKIGNEAFMGSTTEIGAKKISGLEDKYGDVFTLTEDEKTFLSENLEDNIVGIIRKANGEDE